MRILVVEPERRPEVKEIGDSLGAMQEVVGGLIQSVYPFDDLVALICNDEGKLMYLSANRGLRGRNDQIYDIIFGTFFLCGAPADCDHFTSLTSEQIERYRKMFYTPEMFWGMDGHIVACRWRLIDRCRIHSKRRDGERAFALSPSFLENSQSVHHRGSFFAVMAIKNVFSSCSA